MAALGLTLLALFAGRAARFRCGEFGTEQGGGTAASASGSCIEFMPDVTIEVNYGQPICLPVGYSNEAGIIRMKGKMFRTSFEWQRGVGCVAAPFRAASVSVKKDLPG
jgi:hypothetical protein